MFFLLPVGHDQSLRRFPWLTAALMAICLALQIHRTWFGPSHDDLMGATLQRVRAEEPILVAHGLGKVDLRNGYTPAQRSFLAAVREGSEPTISPTERDALAAADAADLAVEKRDVAVRFAFRPSQGLSPNVLFSAFVHGGWLHLLGNMLFLWLVGCNLEDRWGKPAFGALYASGAVASALAFAAWTPHSAVVGASGAIAAAMGAFLVCFATAQIRIFYLVFLVIRVRAGTFDVRALLALPAWFLLQLFDGWLDRRSGAGAVAYSAHVGGFVFGAGVALAVRASGFERRYLLPRLARGVEWEEDPDFVRALELMAGRMDAAAASLLRAVVERNPDHPTARLELCRAAAGAGDQPLAQASLGPAFATLGRAHDHPAVAQLYRDLTTGVPALAFSDRTLSQVARSAVEVGDLRLAWAVTDRLLREHGNGPLAPAALFHLGNALEGAGARREAELVTLQLLAAYPLDAFAAEARRKHTVRA